jgi:hypothetical protein
MARRVGALLFVFLVAGAPAALTACQIACAAHDSHRSADAWRPHSCHGTQPADGPAIGAGAHICGHDEELPAAASAFTLIALAAAASPALVMVPVPDDALPPVAVVISLPGHPRFPLPLRI